MLMGTGLDLRDEAARQDSCGDIQLGKRRDPLKFQLAVGKNALATFRDFKVLRQEGKVPRHTLRIEFVASVPLSF